MLRKGLIPFDLSCAIGSQTGIGGVCWNGHYCPEGTATPLACDQGTFSNVSNLDSCYVCPAGYYCVPGKLAIKILPYFFSYKIEIFPSKTMPKI